MFNIKVFPNFRLSGSDDEKAAQMLSQLVSVRASLSARYVNASFFDYKTPHVEALHFLTYPTGWIADYITGFFSEIDPLFRIDFRTISLVDWADLYRSREQMHLLQRFQEKSLGSQGLTVVDHVEGDVYCALSATFNTSDDDWPRFKAENLEILRFQANTTGETYARLYRRSARSTYNLTPRECECLYWVAMGKTDEQVSQLLSIGRWTVNGHLQSAKCKLGTPSRSAAVARAIADGIITLRRAV